MIPVFLFSPPQSPVFVSSKSLFLLLKVLVLSCSESLCLPPKSPVSSFSQCPVSSSPSSSILFRPLPSSNSRPHPLRVLFHPLKVLSPPPPPIQRKQRNDPKPSRRSWLWVVPKWNMILSLLVSPHFAVARLEHLVAVVSVSQLLPGLVANVMVHSNVKHAVIASPAADE